MPSGAGSRAVWSGLGGGQVWEGCKLEAVEPGAEGQLLGLPPADCLPFQSLCPGLLFNFCFLFFSAGDGTQGFLQIKHSVVPLSSTPSPSPQFLAWQQRETPNLLPVGSDPPPTHTHPNQQEVALSEPDPHVGCPGAEPWEFWKVRYAEPLVVRLGCREGSPFYKSASEPRESKRLTEVTQRV
jgi:hypothetical protein